MRPAKINRDILESTGKRKQSLPKEIDIANLPEGEWVEHGVYRMQNDFAYGTPYGSKFMASPETSGLLLASFGGSQKTVYIDTETTGLSGGAGTYAFLIGVGTAHDDFFRVVQLFLVSPAFEHSMLMALDGEIPENSGIATYNGKQFDIPLIKTRYTMSRMTSSWTNSPHLDLLILARHFYRGILPSCSLSSIESNILGLHRSADDVPGSEIPWIYTNFLKTSDAAPLRGIFYHNMLDIASLAVLQNHFADIMTAQTAGSVLGAHEQLRAGDLWYKCGAKDFAKVAWGNALEAGEEEAAMHIAHDKCTECDYDTACTLYKRVAAHSRRPVPALIAAAKIEEHKLRDFSSALEHANAALEWHVRHKIFHSYEWEHEKREIEHRIERIKNKMAQK